MTNKTNAKARLQSVKNRLSVISSFVDSIDLSNMKDTDGVVGEAIDLLWSESISFRRVVQQQAISIAALLEDAVSGSREPRTSVLSSERTCRKVIPPMQA